MNSDRSVLNRLLSIFLHRPHLLFKKLFYIANIDTCDRVQFSLQGLGLPPEAELNVDSINTGHILLDNTYEDQILIKNQSLIPLEYSIDKKQRKNYWL